MFNTSQGKSFGPVERLVRQDQRIVAISVVLIVFLASLYTFFGVGMNMTALEMTQMARPVGDPMNMLVQPVWSVKYSLLIFFMWWIMMIAMMTPSAAPMLLLYTALKRMGSEGERAVSLSLLFLLGYLVTWALFSAIATGLQFSAQNLGLLSGPMMTISSRIFAAIIVIFCGLYQFSHLKESCLRHCQSPGHFLAEHRRSGVWGAFRTGARHGIHCLGCCWALMALLFVGGIMNLYWIAGMAIYVALEKILPDGQFFVRSTGVVLMLFGGFLLVT